MGYVDLNANNGCAMPWFKQHKHVWKEIARTVVRPVHVRQGAYEDISEDMARYVMAQQAKLVSGSTTILWECQDENCQKTRQETLPGCSE